MLVFNRTLRPKPLIKFYKQVILFARISFCTLEFKIMNCNFINSPSLIINFISIHNSNNYISFVSKWFFNELRSRLVFSSFLGCFSSSTSTLYFLKLSQFNSYSCVIIIICENSLFAYQSVFIGNILLNKFYRFYLFTLLYIQTRLFRKQL